jgi:hypothetical protein
MIKHLKQIITALNGWHFLPGPVTVLLIVVADSVGWDFLLSKSLHEYSALALTGAAILLCIAHLRVHGGALFIILTFFTLNLFCREIHFAGTDITIYLALFLTPLWAWLWLDRIVDVFEDKRFLSIFTSTLFTYFLSQLIARRVFRGIPGEDMLHVPLEEAVETTAHIMLIISYSLASWKRSPNCVKKEIED